MSKKRFTKSTLVLYKLLLTLTFFLACAPFSYGAAPAGYSEYYIPGDETLLGILWNNIGATGATAARHRVINVVAWSPNTKIYYDHWQDGYNFDPNNPDATADEVVVLANKGDSHTFETATIALPQTTVAAGTCKTLGACAYSGKDHIYAAGGMVSVTTESWDQALGNVFTIAWDVYPVKPQMTTYILPFGEDLAAAPRNYRSFDRVDALLEATQDNTVVQLDFNQDGTWDTFCTDKTRATCTPGTSVTLNKGEVFLLDDYAVSPQAAPYNVVYTGTKVQASATLQVNYIIGNHNDTYQARGFSAFPRGFWDTDYYSPTDSSDGTGTGVYPANTNFPTNIYIYNPNSVTLNITYQTTAGTGTFTVPANSTRSMYEQAGIYVPQGSGIYLHGDNVFWGISNMDDGGPTHEWGYGLVPASLLGTEQFIGWAPSGIPITAGDYDYAGVYITPAQDNTTVYVDTNNDGIAEYTYTLNRNQSQYVYNTVTGDMSHSHIWATGPISLAYGQNAAFASTGAPAVDLGYAILPGGNWIDDVLTVTKTANPVLVSTTAGAQSTYTLSVNSYNYDVEGINVTDYLPGGWTYVTGSTTITLANLTQVSGASAEPMNPSPVKYRDTFYAQLYNDNNDNLPAGTTWTTNWIEDGDGAAPGSPTAGNIQVVTDATNGTTYALRFSNNGDAIARMASLPSNVGIGLDFDYRRVLTATTQYVNVQVCPNATNNGNNPITCSAGWQQVTQITGTTTDGSYQHYHADLTSFLASTTIPTNFAIRFTSQGSSAGGGNNVYFDNIQVAADLTWPSSMLGNMAPNQNITIQFTAQTTQTFSAGNMTQNMVQASGSRTVGGLTQTFMTSDFAYNSYGNLTMTKTSNAPNPLYPGNAFTYTTTVNNPAGSGVTLTNVSLYDALPTGVTDVAGTTIVSRASTVADAFNSQSYSLNTGTRNWSVNWTETDISGTTAGPTAGFVQVAGNALQFGYQATNVADNFSSAVYTRNDGNTNWLAAWTENGDNAAAGSGNINVNTTSAGKVDFTRCAAAGCNITRSAPFSGGNVTISFLLTNGSLGAGEFLEGDYSLNGGTSWNLMQSITQTGTLTNGCGNPCTISTAGATSLTVRFIETTRWAAAHHAQVDNVNIAFNDSVGSAAQRTANLTGATSATLNFTYASANLAGTDTVVVQASNAAAGPFTTLATFTAGTPDVAPPYNLTPYISANTTIRFLVTGGINVTNKTFSVDNVTLAYNTLLAGANPPELVSSSSAYNLTPGETLTASFNVTVNNPLATGIDTITNTASTTSTQFPLQFSASVTNLVVNPTSGSAQVGDWVWLDANGNGVQDVGEPGLANIDVTLKDQYGTPLMTTTTDATGHYLFTGVQAGNGYYVEVTSSTLPAGLQQSAPSGHTDNRTNAFNLTASQSYTSANLGYKPASGTATIGNFVWSDANADNIRNPGEPGIAGVTVQLWLDVNGNGIKDAGDTLCTPATCGTNGTTTTAPDGSYLFTGVTAGKNYLVYIDETQTALSGYTRTSPPSGPLFSIMNIGAGASVLYANFGYQGTTYSITDRVWFDANGNGALDTGESGIALVTVELLDASLNAIATTTTDANGYFTFSGVKGGGANYTVKITDTNSKLTNYFGTTTAAKSGTKQIINLTGNIDYSSAPDFGYNLTNSIEGTVFNDNGAGGGTLGDGIQNGSEPGIAGVVVKLYNDANGNGQINAPNDAVIATVTTDANGNYLFSGLSNGNYIVSIESPPSGYTFTGTDSDPGTTGQQIAASIVSNGNALNKNFGYQASTPRSVSGTLWEDSNKNGAIDSGEAGISGVTMGLYADTNGNGVYNPGIDTLTGTTTTASDGTFSFTGLPSGTYFIFVTDNNGVLSGYSPTYQITGGTAGPFTGQETVNLSSGNQSGINFGYYNPIPTLAVISYFGAYEKDGKVIVQWETASEINTLGFNLLRLDPVTAGYKQINPGLLPAMLKPHRGGKYAFKDTGASPGKAYTYKLVEVEATGSQLSYGPFTVVVGQNTLDEISVLSPSSDYIRMERGQPEFQKTLREARNAALKSAQSVTSQAVSGSRIKITVTDSGIYYVDAKDISSLMGISSNKVPSMIAGAQLSLSNQGGQVAYLPAANNAGLYFYGTQINSIYTKENVYWLDKGAGALMPVLKGRGTVAAQEGGSFTETLHLEEDVYMWETLFNDPNADYWFWAQIFASESYTDPPASFTFQPLGPAANITATLQVHLFGGSDAGVMNDHHVVVSLNGVSVEGWWTGLTPYTITGTFPLLSGENTITVAGKADEGVSSSFILIDSFDVTYKRLYDANGDNLFFRGDGAPSVTIGGFTSAGIKVFDLTNPIIPKLNAATTIGAFSASGTASYTVSLKPASANTPYLAVASAGIKAVSAKAASFTSLSSKTNAADYIVIAPAELISTAQGLANYRAGQGMKTMVVNLEDIMNEFNYGISSPEAIKKFLSSARSAWTKVPRYVVLAGDGSSDYKDNLGFGGNLIPSKMVPTGFGLAMSDNYLADINGDHLPEIAIGRLPVVNPDELKTVIGKIKTFESKLGNRSVILVADTPDNGGDFIADSEALAGLFPSGYALNKIYLDDPAMVDAKKAALISAINQGVAFFNYVGHAGPDQLSNSGLLSYYPYPEYNPPTDDLPSLTNAAILPVMTAMTCGLGNFSDPHEEVLTEALLLKSDGGVVAAWSSTGLSDDSQAGILNREFYKAVFSGKKTVLGDAVLQALSVYKKQGSMPFMMDTYCILGDPALRMR